MFEITTYSNIWGDEFPAIQLTWGKVREILGRNHDGSSKDDNILIDALLNSGAPPWVRGADGWIDQYGWGIYNYRG